MEVESLNIFNSDVDRFLISKRVKGYSERQESSIEYLIRFDESGQVPLI